MRTGMLDKLNRNARRDGRDPFTHFEWPESLGDAWCTSPELISIHGTDVYEQLDDATRRRLSLHEAVNFFSLNIHGEKGLVAGLSARLYLDMGPELAEFLHHFVEEENRHMAVFGSFCLRYAGAIAPDRKLPLGFVEDPTEEEFLFFARMLLFEEMVDAFNQAMADDDRLHPLVRRIHRYHHADEIRHLAFGRVQVRELFERFRPEWSAEQAASVRAALLRFHHMMWNDFFSPRIYAAAGLELTLDDIRTLRHSPAARERRWTMTRRGRELLLDLGVEEREVAA